MTTFTSCEQEDIAPVSLNISVTDFNAPEWFLLTDEEQKSAYIIAANDFEYTYWYGISEGEILGESVASNLPNPPITSREQLISQLDFYSRQGIVAPEDAGSLVELLEFFDDCQWDGSTSLNDVSNQLNAFIVSNDVTSTSQPITFHTVNLMEEILVNNLITRSLKDQDGTEIFKNDDGQLCSSTGWGCPSTV